MIIISHPFFNNLGAKKSFISSKLTSALVEDNMSWSSLSRPWFVVNQLTRKQSFNPIPNKKHANTTPYDINVRIVRQFHFSTCSKTHCKKMDIMFTPQQFLIYYCTHIVKLIVKCTVYIIK